MTQPTECHFRSGTGDLYVARKEFSNIWTMGPEGDEAQAVMAGLIEPREPDGSKRFGVEWQQPCPPVRPETATFGEVHVGSREVAYAWSDSPEWAFALAIARRFDVDAVFPLGVANATGEALDEIGAVAGVERGGN